tara:strand:- start:135 stop:404 length:270 start_codon:yes stop_codon:yes gene_type:complete
MAQTKKQKLTKFQEGDTIDLVLNIKGNLVDITFEFLGTKRTINGTEFFNFISKTSNPFKQTMSLKTIIKALPAPSEPATFALPSDLLDA